MAAGDAWAVHPAQVAAQAARAAQDRGRVVPAIRDQESFAGEDAPGVPDVPVDLKAISPA